MKIIKVLRENAELLVYFLLSVFSILPFFSRGFFEFHDDVQVARIYEMGKSISQGMLPVRWVQDLGYGVGYPIFNFYSVLPYYVGGLIFNIGFDALVATKIVFIIGIVLSGVSMFFLVKSIFGKIPALVASIIYLYFPYHAVNVYVRGDLAEVVAYAFLPLVFLGFFKINSLKNDKSLKFYILLSSLSLTAVIISHNLSAFILFIFLGLFILLSLILVKDKRKLIISYFIVFALSFLLSSFYAIPAVLESKYTNVLSVVGGGSDYHAHFVCLSQLWDSQWGFGGSTKGCLDGLSFRLGKIFIGLIAVAVGFFFISFKKLKDKKSIMFFVLLSFILSIFMLLEYSSPIWSLPYFDFLQFPWRFLNFVGLFGSILIGYLVWEIKEYVPEKVYLAVSLIIIVLILLTNVKLFVPQAILDRDASYYTNPNYLMWTASKISDEYLPNGFVSPKNPKEIQAAFSAVEKKENTFYRMKNLNGNPMFDSNQTPLELASDALTLLGFVALIAVIMGKSNILYGKKTS